MITLPSGLNKFMRGQDLAGLKPFALLYRNKWDSVNNKFSLEGTPIDISDLIAKPNTLSMTLDVNEVAQYNANNVTLTLSDTKNYFVEGTPNSYFPEGYQIYGSRVVLYYGTDGVNRTPLFTGVIKELPTHKPENYQVDVKLVSPLEMLKDIEAKDFSDKVTGEALIYKSTDTDGNKIYWTTGTGVGGFNSVYANGTKLFEGIDYETDQLNALDLPAVVTIINSDYYSSTITADYYTWKTGLTVEQIVAGLVGLAGYDTGTEDIRNVTWKTSVRNRIFPDILAAFQFKKDSNDLIYGYNEYYVDYGQTRNVFLGNNFKIKFDMDIQHRSGYTHSYMDYSFGNGINTTNGRPDNGFLILYDINWTSELVNNSLYVYWYSNGEIIYRDIVTQDVRVESPVSCQITINNDTCNIILSNNSGELLNVTRDFYFDKNQERFGKVPNTAFQNYTVDVTANSLTYRVTDFLQKNGFVTLPYSTGDIGTLAGFFAEFEDTNTQYDAYYRISSDLQTWSDWSPISIGADIGQSGLWFQFYLVEKNIFSDISNIFFEILSSTLKLPIVNLSGSTVLESLQDFALISGYEFGVDRQGVFFFRPRVASTNPTYILDHNEIVKVDTVKKNLSNFFTKLTLTFAQIPLEFYANTGERPTPVDRYGIINKEIDKPDIVNYDNPELAQAIGPQLLEVYSAMPNIIQVVGKLNLALELGDIVSLRRNMNLITPEGYTDYSKYEDLNTYYRACKITGLNYNFSKKQVTYTLRDVSNKNTEPMYELEQFVYELPIKLGVKK